MTPFGTDHSAFREALLSGRSAIAPAQAFDTSDCRTCLAAAIDGFDASPWVAPMRMRRMDRTAVYALAATKLALADGGVSIAADGDDRSGVILGTWTAGGGSTQHFLDALFRQRPSRLRRRCCSTARWRIRRPASSDSNIACADRT